jgi:hypothetical protein
MSNKGIFKCRLVSKVLADVMKKLKYLKNPKMIKLNMTLKISQFFLVCVVSHFSIFIPT